MHHLTFFSRNTVNTSIQRDNPSTSSQDYNTVFYDIITLTEMNAKDVRQHDVSTHLATAHRFSPRLALDRASSMR
jgi:hypothetical protein